jgi:hypothetical protein
MGLNGAGASLPPGGSQLSYRGYRLRQERHLGWSVEPLERGPKLSSEWESFETPPSSLADVMALIDWRLDQAA